MHYKLETVHISLETLCNSSVELQGHFLNVEISIKRRIPNHVDKSFNLACWLLPLEKGSSNRAISTSHPMPWTDFSPVIGWWLAASVRYFGLPLHYAASVETTTPQDTVLLHCRIRCFEIKKPN